MRSEKVVIAQHDDVTTTSGGHTSIPVRSGPDVRALTKDDQSRIGKTVQDTARIIFGSIV
jgi:hypothetical protein